MEHDNGAVIVGAFLAVCIITLLVAKIVESVSKFNRRTKYITYELAGACDNDEYRYWHRALRCHYLRLIPFVSRRNVSRLYNLLYYKPKHMKEEERVDILPHILAPSLVGLCLCMVCLCGISWAWFTSNSSTGTAKIQSATYTVSVTAKQGETVIEPTVENGITTVTFDTAGNYTVTITPTGTATTGYCSVQIGENTYYTEQITADFTFKVNAAAGTEITITPKWGSCADTVRTEANKIISGGTVTVSNPAPADTTTPETTTPSGQTDESQSTEPATTPGTAEAGNDNPTSTEQPEETTTSETTPPSGQADESQSTEHATTPGTAEAGSDNPTSTEQPEEATIPPETTE